MSRTVDFRPDRGEPSPYRRKIKHIEPIPNTRSGKWITLECGHRSMALGDLDLASPEGVLCFECKDAEGLVRP